jgi:hypothetical protein
MKMAVFWGVAPCNLLDTDLRFKVTSCLIIREIMEAVGSSEMSGSI